MKFLLVFLLINVAIGYLLLSPSATKRFQDTLTEIPVVHDAFVAIETRQASRLQDMESVTVIADTLQVPWDFVFIPDGILITERVGNLLLITDEGKQLVETVSVQSRGEGGLLGITLHPDFLNNNYLYLYITERVEGEGTMNRVDRYSYSDGTISERVTIIDEIPGALYHDGGRITFGPDGLLYITTGDAQQPSLAQDLTSLAGKILRIHADGSLPEDNPFLNSPVYSYGHRNPQGLAWDARGVLWSTEHGRSGFSSGLDEINRIVPGANYGWPDSEGDTVLEGTQGPVYHSGENETWAPASAEVLGTSIFFGGLRGKTLYEADIRGTGIETIQQHFVGTFGRIRTVRKGPDGALYLTTSNTDGRGIPSPSDDRLLRISL